MFFVVLRLNQVHESVYWICEVSSCFFVPLQTDSRRMGICVVEFSHGQLSHAAKDCQMFWIERNILQSYIYRASPSCEFSCVLLNWEHDDLSNHSVVGLPQGVPSCSHCRYRWDCLYGVPSRSHCGGCPSRCAQKGTHSVRSSWPLVC